MIWRRSPSLAKRHLLRTACEVWQVPRSSVHALTAAQAIDTPNAKRGPDTVQTDADVVALIRAKMRAAA